MKAKILCPYCERSFEPEESEIAEIWKDRADLAARLGSAWRIALEYVDCFRHGPGARINLKKRVRTLGDLVKLWEVLEFTYQGKRYRTTQDEVRRALQTVWNQEKQGFRNHNYLKKILLNGPRRVSAEGLTELKETGREQGRLFRSQDQAKPKEESRMTAEQYKAKMGVKNLTDLIGGSMP